MKTRELIRQLQEADPTGDEECCVENADIHFVSKEPAYYDGALQVLERDPVCRFYNIIGAARRRSGSKIQIRTLSIHDAIGNDPEMPVEYPKGCERYRDGDDEIRREMRAIDADADSSSNRDKESK